MKKKIVVFFICIALIFICGVAIWLFGKKNIGIGEAIAGAIFAIFFEKLIKVIQDFFDTTNWKTTQRKLERGGFIKDDTVIRISFAYLYRININDKYFLVQNSRNTGKYQPVGGVYKLKGNEKITLKNLFHVMDDNKIQIDKSSRDDYRLRMENQYLRKFVKRFDSRDSERERIQDIGREFKEELVNTGILDWKQISYRYCGRHITELKYSEHFQVYELLLADIVELILAPDQEQYLQQLIDKENNKYRFVTAD